MTLCVSLYRNISYQNLKIRIFKSEKLHFLLNTYSYGVYCDHKNNNGVKCQDYKFRLCCAKKYGRYTAWSKWSECIAMSLVETHKVKTSLDTTNVHNTTTAIHIPQCGPGFKIRKRQCVSPNRSVADRLVA